METGTILGIILLATIAVVVVHAMSASQPGR